jgi:hypothetical protein
MDHFKFRVDLVQALLIEHSSEIERKVQGRHSTDKNVPRLLEIHFLKRIPPTEKKARPTEKVCSTLQTQQKEGYSVLVPRLSGWTLCRGLFQDTSFHTKLNF